jgi:hypothetical protein
MSYESVDALQKVLVETVFHYAEDRKKAAGRALGTLVELITYYALKGWGFRENVAIERPMPEYGNPEITHNVEFSLHPILRQQVVPLQKFSLPLTTSKLHKVLDDLKFDRSGFVAKAAQVLTNQGILRNACTFSESENAFCILHSAVQRCKFLSSQAILLQRINVCGLTVRQFPKGLAQGLGPAVYQFVSGICDSCRCGAGIPEQLLC